MFKGIFYLIIGVWLVALPQVVNSVTWTRTYGGELSDEGNSVALTADGGYIVVGSTNSYGAGSAESIFGL
ncbi:MAG: hypothetical protein QMD71_05685 [bacterium]|nr:hypothetical protein [bacterium]